MVISGLVLTLTNQTEMYQKTIQALNALPELIVGELQDIKLPIVMETKDKSESEDYLERIQQIPGVEFVDVVCVHFCDESEQQVCKH
ncbi:MAG: hypothetical protein ACOX5R_00685 [bacterium]|jgi:nitrate reductase NapAB chaperone NapD